MAPCLTTMKKVNPRRRPATQADIERAKQDATELATKRAFILIFNVLRDKEGYDLDGLRRVWIEALDLADSVAKGYCKLSDLNEVLREEEGIRIE